MALFGQISFKFPLLLISVLLIISTDCDCWLFSPRYTPYYYPFPYPVPASMYPGGAGAGTGSSGYLGQSSIQSTPDYSYNWYNYQNYPNSAVLFPSAGTGGGIGAGLPGTIGAPAGSSLLPGAGLGSFLPAPGSLLRSWWSRKFTKLGLRAPGTSGSGYGGIGGGLNGGISGSYGGSSGGHGGGYGLGGYGSSSQSPCINYWSGNAGSNPCLTPSLCCYPMAVIQTNVEPSQPTGTRPSSVVNYQHQQDTVTYPSTGYLYHPSGYKTSTSLSTQASEQMDDVVDSSSSSG